MSKWLVLMLVALAYAAAAANGAAPRDRDRDGLPDRWERRHQLSTAKKSARRDPDRDGLRNRREYRLRTHPRKKDTDGDGLRDGAEVRRYHTNPRRKDTDGDGHSDGFEVRAGTNPDKPKEHPPSSAPRQTPPTSPAPPAPTGFPDASNTGVPPSTNLAVHTSGIAVRAAGAVIDAVDAPSISVEAPNVTIRNSRIGRGTSGLPIVNRSTGLVVEDVTIHGLRGTGISFGNYTARRVEVYGTENGFNAGSNVTIEDSWVHDLVTSGGAHTDGIQFTAGGSGNIVIRHNTLDPVSGASGGTAPIIMHTGGDPQNHDVWIEDNYLDGTGSSVALYCPRSSAERIYVNRNRILRGVFGYTDSCREGSTVTEFDGNVDAVTGRPIAG